MAIWDVITKPVRGIGRLLRGKFRQGLGDIGSGTKSLAPILAATGVGAPLALGIGAAGGALEGATTGGGGLKNLLKGAAGGAARTGAAAGGRALALKYMGGGGPANPSEAIRQYGSGGGGAGTGGATNGVGRLLSSGEGGVRGAGEGIVNAGKGVARWAEAHPTLAGSAISAYGDYESGQQKDRELALYEEELARREAERMRQRERQDNLDPVLAAMIQKLIGSYA